MNPADGFKPDCVYWSNPADPAWMRTAANNSKKLVLKINGLRFESVIYRVRGFIHAGVVPNARVGRRLEIFSARGDVFRQIGLLH